MDLYQCFDSSTHIAVRQAVAKAVEDVTGGTLDVLINNGAYLSVERSEYTLDM